MYSTVTLKVKVPKDKLLGTLIENRQQHSDDYDKAKVGFRILLIKELENKLKAAKDGKKVSLNFKNQKPDNHLNDYDDIIGMLEMASDTEIELDHTQYKQYVQDEWDWMRQWSTSNMMYLECSGVKDTLEEAKQRLRDNWRQGTTCDCCGQHVKLYKRALPIAAVRTLIAMSKAPTDDDGYVHLPPVLDTLTGTAHQGGYATLGQFWGLIEAMPGIRDDGSTRVGYWRITDFGWNFLHNGATVNKYVLLFNGKSYGTNGELITIRQALGNKFNYDELMSS